MSNTPTPLLYETPALVQIQCPDLNRLPTLFRYPMFFALRNPKLCLTSSTSNSPANIYQADGLDTAF